MTKLLMTLNRDLFEEYEKEYFKKNPRARKFPFRKHNTKKKKLIYGVWSLNDLLPINSMQYGNAKKKWGTFGKWVAKKYNFNDMEIENSMIEIRVFSETKANKDCDNIAGGSKLFSDGAYVQSKMFIDDNYNHINPLLIVCDYDKNNPRTEIRISTFNKETKDIYEKLTQHIENWKT